MGQFGGDDGGVFAALVSWSPHADGLGEGFVGALGQGVENPGKSGVVGPKDIDHLYFPAQLVGQVDFESVYDGGEVQGSGCDDAFPWVQEPGYFVGGGGLGNFLSGQVQPQGCGVVCALPFVFG